MQNTFANTTAKKWIREPVNGSPERDEFGHLTQFLQDQIVKRRAGPASNRGPQSSRGSKRSVPGNNSLIEQAAKLKGEGSDV